MNGQRSRGERAAVAPESLNYYENMQLRIDEIAIDLLQQKKEQSEQKPYRPRMQIGRLKNGNKSAQGSSKDSSPTGLSRSPKGFPKSSQGVAKSPQGSN